MIAIDDICKTIVSSFNGKILSDIGPAPSDIDIYIPIEFVIAACKYLDSAGFVRTSVSNGQSVYRRFECGQLYIVDVLSSFEVYTKSITSFLLSEAGHKRIGASLILHKCFRYLCCGSLEKVEYINKNQKYLSDFFVNPVNFNWIHPSLILAARSDHLSLIKVARSPYLGRKLFNSYLEAKWINPFFNYWNRIGKGFSIAFVGPDGSGKTYIINRLKPVGVTRSQYMGDWFFTLQNFYDLLMRFPSPYNRALYLFYFLENMIRFLRVYFQRFIGRIVLIDRYPGMNRNIIHDGFLGWINRITFFIFPKPDLIVFLYAPAHVIYARKQELTIVKIEEMQNRILSLLKDKNYLVLDTRLLDESLNIVLRKIYRS